MSILAGFLIGLLIGLTGMGGGALMTPYLILVMKLDPVLAVGTDLAFAAVTKIVGGVQHYREDNTSLTAVLWMALGSVPASFIGARYVLTTSDDAQFTQIILPNILGIVLLLVSMIILARNTRLLSAREDAERWPSPLALIVIGAIGGFLVGVTSIGGGTVIMALLIVFFSIPLKNMVGLDVTHAAILTVVPAATYAFNQQTDWSLVFWLLVGSVPGVWLGARAVKRLNPVHVRTVLGILILAAGLQLLFGGH